MRRIVKFHFSSRALLCFLILLLVELCIALFVNDRIIRPYVGDVLVIPLIYYFFRSFIITGKIKLILAVFLFACAVEAAQYYNLVQQLGLQHSCFWTIVIGNSFHWLDMLAYATGAVLVWCAEWAGSRKTGNRSEGDRH
jgi:hypothetical protein